VKTPWINKKKMKELISNQTNTFMRFPIKPIVLECVCEIEENIESSRSSSKQENQSKQTGDSKRNKDQMKKNEPVKDENRNNPFQESKINQNGGAVHAKINQPASSKKNLNLQRDKLSSFQKPLSKAKEIDPNRETNLQVTANDRMTFTKDRKIKYSKTSNEKLNNISEQISPFEENVMATLEVKPSSPQLVEVTAETNIDEFTPIHENETIYTDEEYIPASEETVATTIEEDSSTSRQIKDTVEVVLENSNNDTKPMAADEEQPHSTEENVMTAIEEDPSTSHQIKVTGEEVLEENSINHDSEPTAVDEEQPPFSEENVMATLEVKPSSPQLVEVTAEASIDEYTLIQENETIYTVEEYIPASEETVATTIEENSSTSHQIKVTAEAVLENSNNYTKPMATDEEHPFSPEENVITVREEDPSSFQPREVTAEAIFVESPPIETIGEMGYDQTNPPLSEESSQEHTSHGGTVGEKERELTIPVSSDKVKTYLEDQESQKISNDHKEEQLNFSKDLFDINDLKRNNMNTATDFLNIQIPVILGKYNIEISLEDEEIFAEKVKEIREISKKVVLTTCEFIPSELSPELDNGSCKVLKGNLMIEGFIQQDIKYIFENQQTQNYVQNQSAFNKMNQKNSMYLRKLNFGRYSYAPQPYSTNSPNPAQTNHGQYSERLINSMSKSIPFSSIVEINHFLHPPLFGSIEEKSFIFQNNLDQQISAADPTQFIKTTYYPENTHGKLIYSKIHENSNIFKHEEKYIKTPRIKLKQFIVLELGIHLLQEQSVQVPMLENGFKSTSLLVK
jgi:hypothetical protein